jgi:hypothetical protein
MKKKKRRTRILRRTPFQDLKDVPDLLIAIVSTSSPLFMKGKREGERGTERRKRT